MISALSSSWRTNIARQNHVPRCWRNWWSVLSHIAEDGSWTLQQHEVSVTSLMKAHFWRKLYMWVIHWNILCWPIRVSCMNVFHFRPLRSLDLLLNIRMSERDLMRIIWNGLKQLWNTQKRHKWRTQQFSSWSVDIQRTVVLVGRVLAHMLHGSA